MSVGDENFEKLGQKHHFLRFYLKNSFFGEANNKRFLLAKNRKLATRPPPPIRDPRVIKFLDSSI